MRMKKIKSEDCKPINKSVKHEGFIIVKYDVDEDIKNDFKNNRKLRSYLNISLFDNKKNEIPLKFSSQSVTASSDYFTDIEKKHGKLIVSTFKGLNYEVDVNEGLLNHINTDKW